MVADPASPVCYADEADDCYQGFAGRDEIAAALAELLEAHRAGAQDLRAASRTADASDHAPLLAEIRTDLVYCRTLLSREIRRLGGVPSRLGTAVTAAASEVGNRLAALTDRQSWALRRLDGLLPRIRDDGLHKRLRAAADRQRRIIACADRILETAGPGRPAHRTRHETERQSG